MYVIIEASKENVTMIFVLDFDITFYNKRYKYVKHLNSIICVGNESDFLLLGQNGRKDDKAGEVQGGGSWTPMRYSSITVFLSQDAFGFKQQ